MALKLSSTSLAESSSAPPPDTQETCTKSQMGIESLPPPSGFQHQLVSLSGNPTALVGRRDRQKKTAWATSHRVLFSRKQFLTQSDQTQLDHSRGTQEAQEDFRPF